MTLRYWSCPGDDRWSFATFSNIVVFINFEKPQYKWQNTSGLVIIQVLLLFHPGLSQLVPLLRNVHLSQYRRSFLCLDHLFRHQNLTTHALNTIIHYLSLLFFRINWLWATFDLHLMHSRLIQLRYDGIRGIYMLHRDTIFPIDIFIILFLFLWLLNIQRPFLSRIQKGISD